MNNILTRKRKGLSPMLATVILIGVTVAAGGATYAIYTGSSTAATTSNVIRVDSATAVRGSNHGDFAITISNVGTNSWKKVEVWVAKEGTGRPILYEELHEMAYGKDQTSGKIDNPLRVDAIGALYDGFGVGLGRKFVVDTETKVGAGHGAVDDKKVPVAATGFTAGTDTLAKLDAKYKGAASNCTATMLDKDGDGTGDTPGCEIRTMKKIDAPIAPGESMRFYADMLMNLPSSVSASKTTLDSTTQTTLDGLTALQVKPAFVDSGDELVVNIKVVDLEGAEAQMQTIVRITGV